MKFQNCMDKLMPAPPASGRPGWLGRRMAELVKHSVLAQERERRVLRR